MRESEDNIIYIINLLNWYTSCIIEVVYIQCFKLFKGANSAVYGNVHYNEQLKSFYKSRASSRLQATFYRDIAMIVQEAT